MRGKRPLRYTLACSGFLYSYDYSGDSLCIIQLYIAFLATCSCYAERKQRVEKLGDGLVVISQSEHGRSNTRLGGIQLRGQAWSASAMSQGLSPPLRTPSQVSTPIKCHELGESQSSDVLFPPLQDTLVPPPFKIHSFLPPA
jgi:hypothetical protein